MIIPSPSNFSMAVPKLKFLSPKFYSQFLLSHQLKSQTKISVVEKTDSLEAREKNCSEGEESGIAEEREFVPSSGIDSNGDSEETVEAEQSRSEKQEEVNDEGGLDLLIEAAELISDNFKNDESEPDKLKRNDELLDY